MDENFRFVGEYLAEQLPKAKYCVSEATYLAWVDLSECFEAVNTKHTEKYFGESQ